MIIIIIKFGNFARHKIVLWSICIYLVENVCKLSRCRRSRAQRNTYGWSMDRTWLRTGGAMRSGASLTIRNRKVEIYLNNILNCWKNKPGVPFSSLFYWVEAS